MHDTYVLLFENQVRNSLANFIWLIDVQSPVLLSCFSPSLHLSQPLVPRCRTRTTTRTHIQKHDMSTASNCRVFMHVPSPTKIIYNSQANDFRDTVANLDLNLDSAERLPSIIVRGAYYICCTGPSSKWAFRTMSVSSMTLSNDSPP